MAGPIFQHLSTNSIYVLWGRFLQGAGAIGQCGICNDCRLVKEEERAHAMAIMGGTIALSFCCGDNCSSYWSVEIGGIIKPIRD